MKFRQHIKTSASKRLYQSGQGYGTVAIHPDIPSGVRDYTEQLGISAIEGGPDTSYCFAIVEEWILLNRTKVAPADQTGRSNHIAHTLTAKVTAVNEWLEDQIKTGHALWSPAALMLEFEKTGIWRDSWTEDPRELGGADFVEIPKVPSDPTSFPHIWKDRQAKGLTALDEYTHLKHLKWEWNTIKDASEQLAWYADTFFSMDPDLGIRRRRSEIEKLFPEHVKNSWSWTFATVLAKSQRADEFKWFGVTKERAEGSNSPRETFSPCQAEAPMDDLRARYIRDKNAVENEMNQEIFERAKQNVNGILKEWETKLKNKVWAQSNGDCLADEIVNCKHVISGLAEGIDKMSRDLEELERKMESTRTDLEKEQKNAISWKDYASSLVAVDESIRRPAGLEQAMQELEAASSAWKQSSTESIQNDHQELVQLYSQILRNIQSLQAKMSSIYQSTPSPFRGKMHEPKEFQTALLRPSKSTSPISLGPVREPTYGQASLLIGRQGQRVGLGQEQAHPVESADSMQLMEQLEYGSSTNLRRNAFSAKIAFITVTLLVLVGMIVWSIFKEGKKEAESSKSDIQKASAQIVLRAPQPQPTEVDPENRASSEVMRLWWLRFGGHPKHDTT